MAGNKLIFQSADKAKAAITDAAKKEIAKLYSDWADEIGEKALYYKTKTNASSWLQEQNMRQLQAQLTATSHQISNEVYGIAKDSIYQVSDAVVQANNKWLIGLGFPVDGVNSAFVSVPDQTVRRLITGQIYESGWSLSKAIWTDNEKTLRDIYGIVAKGLAENMSAYDISKLLEKYVSPSKAKQWNLKMPDGVKIYKKSVDYNAQRLVRTLAQHGYQQSFIAVTKDNPFVEDYIWVANGSRTCALCAERDGKHYAKDELPMDHPNGMCTMVPNVDDKKMIDQLADWVNSPDGTYPDIDEFAGNFGYEANSIAASTMRDKFTDAGFKRIVGNHDYKSDAKACNPGAYIDNADNYMYQQNCSHTVPTYEMRRRGYDVVATGAKNNDKYKAAGMRAWGYNNHDMAYRNGVVKYVNAKRSNKIADEISQALIEAGDGARFEIRVGWKTGGGHFFVGENVGGKIIFIDPQNGEVGDVAKNYMFNSKPSQTWYTRIDNIELNPEIMKELMR